MLSPEGGLELPVNFTPDNLPRYDSGLLSYLDTNFQRLKNSLRDVAVETVGSIPTAPYLGQRYVDTTLGIDYVWNGTAWVITSHWGAPLTYTPTWTQSATISHTVNNSEHKVEGKRCTGQLQLTATSSGTASNALNITTPYTATMANQAVGSGWLYDSSVSTNYPFIVYLTSTTAFRFVPADGQYTNILGISSFSAAIASGDSIQFEYGFWLA